METHRPRRLSGCPYMTALTVLSVAPILGSGCGSPSELVNEAIAGPSYTLTVKRVGVSGDSVQYEGIETIWQPSSLHVELGPEISTGEPIASFWMDSGPACLDPSTGKFAVGAADCGLDFRFYSIEFPGNDIGDQNAYRYSYKPGSVYVLEPVTTGIYNGVEYVRGKIAVGFTGIPPVIGEAAPPDVQVTAKFVAVHYWPPR